MKSTKRLAKHYAHLRATIASVEKAIVIDIVRLRFNAKNTLKKQGAGKKI